MQALPRGILRHQTLTGGFSLIENAPGQVRDADARTPQPAVFSREDIMPETYKTGEYKGSPTFSVLTGVSQKGEEYWFTFGVKKAQAILENIDALRAWVDKHERGR